MGALMSLGQTVAHVNFLYVVKGSTFSTKISTAIFPLEINDSRLTSRLCDRGFQHIAQRLGNPRTNKDLSLSILGENYRSCSM
jgi:hypothetical protein